MCLCLSLLWFSLESETLPEKNEKQPEDIHNKAKKVEKTLTQKKKNSKFVKPLVKKEMVASWGVKVTLSGVEQVKTTNPTQIQEKNLKKPFEDIHTRLNENEKTTGQQKKTQSFLMCL